MMVDQLAKAGGLFFFLTFIHFIADWVFQTHNEAVAKSKDAFVRAAHCTHYTLLMAPSIWLVCRDLTWSYHAISLTTLWVSHFIGDSYFLVYLWIKHIRNIPPESQNPKEPLTLILAIVVDQLWHLLFLWVPISFAVWG